MAAKRQTHPDSTGAMVTAGMLLLAVIGVLAVFHGPIAAVLFPPAPDGELSGAGAERPLSAQQR